MSPPVGPVIFVLNLYNFHYSIKEKHFSASASGICPITILLDFTVITILHVSTVRHSKHGSNTNALCLA